MIRSRKSQRVGAKAKRSPGAIREKETRPAQAASAPRADATRQRVLDAALAVYAEHGHEGFGIHAIVAQSGVSLGSIYHHFGSMDGLAAALYARCMSALVEQVAAALSGAGSLRRGVASVVESYLQFAHTQRTQLSFIHASAYASFLPAHAAQIAASKARMQEIRAFFAQHSAAGEIAPVPAWLLEVLVIGPVAELTRRWLAEPDTYQLELAAPILTERILASIRTPRSRRA